MKKIKKGLSVTLALLLCSAMCVFAACGDNPPNAPTSSSTNSSVVDSSVVDSSVVDSSVIDSSVVDSSVVDSREDVSDSVDSSVIDSSEDVSDSVDSSVIDSSEDSSHSHEFGDWMQVLPVVNCEEATFQRTCAGCDETEERPGTYEDHVWSAEYVYDTTHHWISCDVCGADKEKETHVDKGEGVCDVCKNLLPTDGVVYNLSQDGTYAIVTGYEGMDSMVVLSPKYEGAPVTEIAAAAFQNNTWITSVDIPDTVTDVGAEAFCGCTDLEGVKIPDSVVRMGDNAFGDCRMLTAYCEADGQPADWSENWNPYERMVIWGYTGKRMTLVPPQALMIGEGMLNVDEPDRRQIIQNEDLGDVRGPECFSSLTRFDSQTSGAGAWKTGVLNHYNFDSMNLRDYSEVWFAAKVVGGFWVFVGNEPRDTTDSWVYFHITKGDIDKLGNVYWTIEASIGGYVFARIENQLGRYLDKDRPVNSIARLFWDEGFGSADGNSILIYPLNEAERVTIYCTEIVGISNDY